MLLIEGRLHYGEQLRKAIPPCCYIRIYERLGDYPDPTRTRVAIFCELSRKDYEGLSVTNGAEHIVTALWQQLWIHPDRAIYIEHYADERLAIVRHSPWRSKSKLNNAESFDLVTCRWENGQAYDPNWKTVDRRFVESLIGESFQPLNYITPLGWGRGDKHDLQQDD